MAFADPQRVVAEIYSILGRPGQAVLPREDVHAARVHAGMDVLRAVAQNPRNSYFGSLATLVTLTHNSFLPAFDGEPGIPLIVPYSGAQAIDGIPATPSEIDSYRSDPTSSVYTGARDGVRVAHDASDSGLPSPVSCRYAIVGGRFKFTGYSAQIPLIQLTRTMADTGVPENYEPTVVKLSIPRLVKPDNPLYQMYAALGSQDLSLIQRGEMQVPPLPVIEAAQKAEVV